MQEEVEALPRISLPLPSESSIESFCEQAEELVDNVVGGWIARTPTAKRMDFREAFKSAGWLATLEAYHEFDSDKNDAVTPFVIDKIRWALFNELNLMVGPSIGAGMKGGMWAKVQKIFHWANRFEEGKGRRPSLAEVEAEFPNFSTGVLLDAMLIHGSSTPDRDKASFIGLEAEDPADLVERNQRVEMVRDWLEDNLSERDQDICRLVMFENMTHEEVGAEYELTKQRVGQIIRFATDRMREQLG